MASCIFFNVVVLGSLILLTNSQEAPEPVAPKPAVPVPVAGAGASPSQPTFSNIQSEFVGGVQAIRNSAGKIVGWGANQVVQGVRNVVQPVVDVGRNIVNKTVVVTQEFRQAGGQIVDAWGNAARQTGNITGQLVGNVGRRKRR